MQTRHFSTLSSPMLLQRIVTEPEQSWHWIAGRHGGGRDALFKKGTASAAVLLTPGIFIQQQKRKHICHLTALWDGKDVGELMWCPQGSTTRAPPLSFSLYNNLHSLHNWFGGCSFAPRHRSLCPPPTFALLPHIISKGSDDQSCSAFQNSQEQDGWEVGGIWLIIYLKKKKKKWKKPPPPPPSFFHPRSVSPHFSLLSSPEAPPATLQLVLLSLSFYKKTIIFIENNRVLLLGW